MNKIKQYFFVLTLIIVIVLIMNPSNIFANNKKSGFGWGWDWEIEMNVLGSYKADGFDEGAAEIPAYDETTCRVFVVNGKTVSVDILDVHNPYFTVFISSIDIAPYGNSANSVYVHDGIVAVAVQSWVKTDPGSVVFFDTNGEFINKVTVGSQPDMITFTPNGKMILTANEGEPNDDYSIDPEGTVSIIDISKGIVNITDSDVTTIGFSGFTRATLDPSVRIFGPNATVAQDIEPEYITVSEDSKRAWATLQENNAIAFIDLEKCVITKVVGLGFKNHSQEGNGLDVSDKDSANNIANWPVFGMYLPDGISSFKTFGKTFLVTANEGDTRDWAGFSEESTVSDLDLDPQSFPTASELKQDSQMGRLVVTSTMGDLDKDGDYDQLFSFGARSFSIWDENGKLVYDSGDLLEKITLEAYPDYFNANHTSNKRDNRSDNKGPEPEGLTIGYILNRPYLFLGLERIGGVAIFDLTHPSKPKFVQYLNNRDFTGNPEEGTAKDLGPEGLIFIPAHKSPTHKPMLIVSNEVSGHTTLYNIEIIKKKKK